MNKSEALYAVAVATALLRKTSEKDIGKYLKQYDETDINIIRELQPILLDFRLSNDELEVKIQEIFNKYKVY